MKKYFSVTVFLLVLIIIGIYLYHVDNKRSKSLKDYGYFTIGTTYDVSGSLSAPALTYSYSVNGVKYCSQVRAKNKKALGSRFYLVFLKNKPYKSRLLLYYPVPKNIKEAPKNGWKTMPEVDYSLRDSLNLEIYKEESNENLKESEWK